LSLSRAEAVTNYIARQGISMGRLTAEGRASANPIGDNSTEQGRALNRRVELFLYAVKQ
jgi:outer membrane protein OmpA-like peptidoglycan-associated protein